MGLSPIRYSVAQDTTPKTLSSIGLLCLAVGGKGFVPPLERKWCLLSQSCPNDGHFSLNERWQIHQFRTHDQSLGCKRLDDTVALTERNLPLVATDSWIPVKLTERKPFAAADKHGREQVFL